MGNLSKNFNVEEFLSKATLDLIDAKGQNPKRYINYALLNMAEAIRAGLNTDFRRLYSDVVKVSMVGNKPRVQARGFRAKWDKTSGASLSDHFFFNAFDFDVNLHFKDGSVKEADYDEVLKIITNRPEYYLKVAGVTMIEDSSIAKTWCHCSMAWTGLSYIKIIGL